MLAGAAGGLVAVGVDLLVLERPARVERQLLERAAAIGPALPLPSR